MPYWGPLPKFKIVADPAGAAITYENDQAIELTIVRPENNVPHAMLRVNDYKNKNYQAVFAANTLADIYLWQGSDTPTKVFRGNVTQLAPTLDPQAGEVLDVQLWGAGNGLIRTHCSTSYGVESENPTITTVQDILIDICDNYVEKQFNGAVTNWTLNTGKIEDVLAALDITFLDGRYVDNFTLVNRVCDIATAYAASVADVGPHWMIDPDSNLYVKQLDDDSADTLWPEYWKGSQTASTLTVAEDMLLYGFAEHMTEYANHIILASDLRKPGYDYWTENAVANALWGDANGNLGDSAIHVVGANSLIAEPTAAGNVNWWYPSARTAAWNIPRMGSINTIPRINFYCYVNQDPGDLTFSMHTDTDEYYYIQDIYSDFMNVNEEWVHISLPIGDYYKTGDESKRIRWIPFNVGGDLNWNNINYVMFTMGSGAGESNDAYVDDLHFSGKVIREARDTSEITTYGDWQKIILNDVAVDDSLKEADDTGTAARLAYAEVLRRAVIPTTTNIHVPLAIDFLPGQKTYTQACVKVDGTYRVQEDFRASLVTHTVNPAAGARTILTLTNDLSNSHAKTVPNQHGMLMEYVGSLGHREAKDLKSSGIDPLITRLLKDY